MKIFIVDKTKLTKHNLPSKIEESYSFLYKPFNSNLETLLVFEAENNSWKLKSNNTIHIFYNKNQVDSIKIQPYQYYFLKIVDLNTFVILYVLPSVKEHIFKVDLTKITNLKLGNDVSSQIIYNHPLINKNQAIFKRDNTNWTIECIDDINFPVFINNNRVIKKNLQIGDVIFVAGLKIIWMGNFFGINNPNNLVSVVGLSAYNESSGKINSESLPVSEEDKNKDLYQDKDYFYYIPRIREMIEDKEIKIDAPPSKQVLEDMPWILTIGSSLTMSAGVLMMMANVYVGFTSQTRTWITLMPQIIMCLAMIIGSLIIPRATRKYQKRKSEKLERKRQKEYSEYLEEKEKEISLLTKKQVQILNDNNPSVYECKKIIDLKSRDFWSRNVSDDDFLLIRLGNGEIDAPFEISAPEEHFSLEKDNLLENVYQITEKYKKLTKVPISVNLAEEKISSLIFKCSYENDYVNGLILQMISLHSPENLKIVIFTSSNNVDKWNYFKYLPHCWSADRQHRFFASNQDEAKEISNYLEEEYKKRKEIIKSSVNEETDKKIDKKDSHKNFETYYLIINDDYSIGKNTIIVNNIIKDDENLGFSLLVISDNMKFLPSNCECFIEVSEKDGAVMKNDITSKTQKRFLNEYDPTINMKEISAKLANIPFVVKKGISVLPNSLAFLEMYGVSKVEQLNILNNWQTNNPVLSLNTPVGVHEDGELFKLNLHEKAHGPHGLIAGSTGSGKSEFIITYILSMAINYHPYEVQFVLIDYKGGGLAGAFENKETGVAIPHLIGTITNLDTSEMNRSLVSIESEIKRRQRIFNETRDSLNESTIDIYKYQKLYREGVVKEPLAHLFIISDEFAELKSQQPEFMQQLISISRIGRSLGVHLILATQKPSGVVNDQIWSNSKFKVCLKVQNRSDSMEMLKRPEAASIKETGRFYLQVGYDDLFDIGQSAWSGAKYIPSDQIIRKVDDSIDFVDNVGNVIKTIKDVVKQDNTIDYGEQLTNIVKYIYNLGKKSNIVTNKLWLDPIPSEIFLDNIKKKYNYKPQPYIIAPVIGEYDNPAMQEQGIVNLNLTNQGNTLIYGQTGSGKENLLNTIILSSILEHTPQEVNFYIFDFGSESLKTFNKMPHVGEVVTIESEQKIIDTFNMLSEEIEKRRDLFTDYAGSYVEYCSNSGNKLPLLVCVINSYEVFAETYPRIAEDIQTMYRDGSKYGIIFIISCVATNSIRNRTAQYFNNVICLQIANNYEYRELTGCDRNLFPAKIFGRGIIKMEKGAFEFQTALYVPRKDNAKVIRQLGEYFSQAYQYKAKKVPSIPKIITTEDFKEKITTLDKLPIGYSTLDKEIYSYNFISSQFTPIITHNMDNDKMDFIYALMIMFKNVQNTKVSVIDAVSAYERNIEGIECINNNFDNEIIKINNYIIQNKDSNIKNIYFVLGIGSLFEIINSNTKEIINRLFSNINMYSNTMFILIDTYSSYKKIQLTNWYQTSIDSGHGIWLGNDIGSQTILNIIELSMEDRKLDFQYLGYAIDKGKYIPFKSVIYMEDKDEK